MFAHTLMCLIKYIDAVAVARVVVKAASITMYNFNPCYLRID
jgi:hypothetical protein